MNTDNLKIIKCLILPMKISKLCFQIIMGLKVPFQRKIFDPGIYYNVIFTPMFSQFSLISFKLISSLITYPEVHFCWLSCVGWKVLR